MSATNQTAVEFEVGAVAHVQFRVRCDALGPGEEVFLVAEGDPQGHHKKVPLYTNPVQYPWYHSLAPLTLTLPSRALVGEPRKKGFFVYRYAIHRAGVFYRWEQPSDAHPSQPTTSSVLPSSPGSPTDLLSSAKKAASTSSSTKLMAGEDDISTERQQVYQGHDQRGTPTHEVPLHLMENRECYIVNDILGVTTGPPDIDHVKARVQPAYTQASTLHSRTNSSMTAGGSANAATGGAGNTAADPAAKLTASPAPTQQRKTKTVGFASSPLPSNLVTAAGGHGATATAKQAVHLNSTDGLVVVSAFLPVILHRSDHGQWSADWDYEMLLSMQTHLRVTRVGVVKWRGWHGNTGAEGSPEAGVPRDERPLVEECLRPFHCVPVWIDPALFGDMYNGFCKGVLWPVLHNVTSVYSHRPDDNADQKGRLDPADAQQFSEYSMDDVEQGPIHGGRGREAELWGAYNSVNRQFAETIVQCFNEGDLIWVHGFHLLILPSYLTRRLPMAKVGIFLHTPFPSSEIFRTLWCREDLLRGILNADQVGFHLFEYARHFLTSCRRLLGLNYGMIPDSSGGHTLAIDLNGRHVVVTSIHAGVEPPVLSHILTHSTTLEKAISIRNRFQGKHIFCAIDRLESLKGIPLKLLSLELFLKRCPEWVGKVALIQIGISAFERGEDYYRTKQEVLQLVQKINNLWPDTIQFQECRESEMRLQQRVALLRAADVVVVTPIRDGLNLLPLEFTIAHQDALTEIGAKDGRKRGVCILSEFASCTRVMRGALHVNPWKLSEIANAFYSAVNMTEDERLRRIRIASEFATRVTTQRWALAVMLDLKGVHKNVNPVQVSGAGLGLGYRLLGMNTGFVSLDTGVVAKAYKNSRARLIFLDYGGTIVSNDNLDNLRRFQMVKERSVPSVPTPKLIAILTELCADNRNTVFVVSGKERHSLTKTLGSIPNLGLAAEHGMFISWPTSRVSKRRWETLVPETDRTWRSLAMTIMEVYTSRTHGSYIEETEMKVLWQYRDADLEFGSLQAKELEDHLAKYLRSFPVDILHGGIEEGGYVEVRPKGVNKGVLAMRVIRRFPDIAAKDRVDFSLVLGDDHCDEPMLSVMRQIGRRVIDARRALNREDPLSPMPATIQLVDVSSCDNYVAPDLEVFTCTVGKKPSAAANYLHDVEEVHELLESLVKLSTRDQKYYSSVDLRGVSTQEVTGFQELLLQPEVMDETVSKGFSKSMSLDQFRGQTELTSSTRSTVSANLNDFLRLGTIEDDDDEEAFFF